MACRPFVALFVLVWACAPHTQPDTFELTEDVDDSQDVDITDEVQDGDTSEVHAESMVRGQVRFSPTLFPPPWGSGSMTVRVGLPSGLGPVFASHTIELEGLPHGDTLPFELVIATATSEDLAVVATYLQGAGPSATFTGRAGFRRAELADPAFTLDVVIDEATFADTPEYCGDDPLDAGERACVFEFVWRFGATHSALVHPKGIDWDAVYVGFRAAALDAPSDVAFYAVMADMVTRLKDHHWIYAGLPLAEQFLGCPSLPVVIFDGVVQVAASEALPDGIVRGDEIVSLDGAPIAERLALGGRIYSDHHPLRFEALARQILLCGVFDSVASVGLRTASGLVTIEVRRNTLLPLSALISGGPDLDEADLVSTRSFTAQPVGLIGYARITTFDDPRVADRFDDVLETQPNADAWIIDVRGNSGGLLDVMRHIAGRFLVAPHSPFDEVALDGARAPYVIAPSGAWQFDGPVVILTDELSYSASSIFASAMRSRGATLVGRPTGGGTSPIHFERYRLTSQSLLSTSSDRYFDLEGDGAEVDLSGVPPDITVRLVLDDLLDGHAYAYGTEADPTLAEALQSLSR